MQPNVDKFSFNNIFSAQYDNYLLFLENTSPYGPEYPAISIGFRRNGITYSNTDEYLYHKITYLSSTMKINSGNDNCFRTIIANHGNGFSIIDKIEINAPFRHDVYSTIHCQSMFNDLLGRNFVQVTNGMHKTPRCSDGIELTWDSSLYVRSGKLTIYGYKK